MLLDVAVYERELTAARLRLGVTFTESKHPRGLDGRFRRLIDKINRTPGVDVSASLSDRGIVLHMVKVDKEHRGKGHASKALKQLTEFADTHGQTMGLTPERLPSGGMSKSALAVWYRNAGFKANKGRNKDFAFSESMIREPSSLPPPKKQQPMQKLYKEGGGRAFLTSAGQYGRQVSDGKPEWHIDDMEVPKEQRRQGVARRLMEQIVRDADASGVRLTLRADAKVGPDEIAQPDLERFYASFGFQSRGILMMREPQAAKSETPSIADTAPVTAEFLDALSQALGSGSDTHTYKGLPDLVKREGRAWNVENPTGPPTPPEYEALRGELGQCFMNAGAAVTGGSPGLPPGARYVEGYAYTPHGWPPMPVHHAWIVDGTGEVLEVTWPEMGTEYVGVEIPVNALSRMLLQRKMWGVLDNWEQGYPEMKGDWQEYIREP